MRLLDEELGARELWSRFLPFLLSMLAVPIDLRRGNFCLGGEDKLIVDRRANQTLMFSSVETCQYLEIVENTKIPILPPTVLKK